MSCLIRILAATDRVDKICSVYILKQIADSHLQAPWQGLD